MGTDIHGVFQAKEGDVWKDIPSKYQFNRHYQLFAVLAGVRNGYGFAGVPTGQRVHPIAESRGYPEDFQVDCDEHKVASLDVMSEFDREYAEEHPHDSELWMGDHNHSWVTSKEVIEWYERAPTVIKTGVLSRGEYEAWDKHSTPEMYCGGISGPNILTIDEPDIGRTKVNWTHVSVTWERNLAEELKYFVDEMRRLEIETGQVREIRFVFGFDS